MKTLKPPEAMTVSEWADKNREIPPGTSNLPGRWKTSRTPYLRGIMDAFTDDLVEEIVFVKSTQVGGTECILNILGYIPDQDPAPTLVIYPSEDLAEDISRTRIEPMLLACKTLEDRYLPAESNLLLRTFSDMYIALSGANSAAALASRPIRFLLLDEVDKYPPRAGGGREADPISLARERTNTFSYNKKIFLTSTPTLKTGAIWREFESCTRQLYFYLPCPHCGAYQRLRFEQVRFPKEGDILQRARAASYQCENCLGAIGDAQKAGMLQQGRWQTKDGQPQDPKKTGFALNALYSPWLTFGDVAYKWLDAQGDTEKLQNVVNSWFGEPWENVGSSPGIEKVLACQGDTTEGVVPDWAQLITAGVDVQKACLYYVIRAWGAGKRSRLVHRGQILGMNFAALLEVLNQPYHSQQGREWYVDFALIDSGDQTEMVYAFCYVNQPLTLPAKGSSRPMTTGARFRVSHVTRDSSTARGMDLILCDGGQYKDMIYARMGAESGPWEVFDGIDEDYCKQLTSEHKVFERSNGAERYVWKKKTAHADNHYLDCEVYAACAAELAGAFALLEEDLTPQEPPPARPWAASGEDWVGGWGEEGEDWA